jgi:hypothetical protein
MNGLGALFGVTAAASLAYALLCLSLILRLRAF